VKRQRLRDERRQFEAQNAQVQCEIEKALKAKENFAKYYKDLNKEVVDTAADKIQVAQMIMREFVKEAGPEQLQAAGRTLRELVDNFSLEFEAWSESGDLDSLIRK
jgi:hypothetical protein